MTSLTASSCLWYDVHFTARRGIGSRPLFPHIDRARTPRSSRNSSNNNNGCCGCCSFSGAADGGCPVVSSSFRVVSGALSSFARPLEVLSTSRRCRVTNASILTDIKDLVKDSNHFKKKHSFFNTKRRTAPQQKQQQNSYKDPHRMPNGKGGENNGGADTPEWSSAFMNPFSSPDGWNPTSASGENGPVVEDLASNYTYAKKRQADALAYAILEKEQLAEKARRQLQQEDEEEEDKSRKQALLEEAAKLGGPAAVAQMQEKIEEDGAPYVKSMKAFGDRSVKLQHSFSGLADNRIIRWYENAYWNYLRYFFTQELLIGKDRFGNKFTVTWQFHKSRGEQRRMYRRDANKKHQPYGALSTDDRLWERWMRGHRAVPPSVAEEEHYRSYKKAFFGAIVVEDEEVEDTLMRLMAHLHRAQSTFQELDEDQVYGDANRATKPLRQTDRSPGMEAEARNRQRGATWTMGFVRGDLFYNEEETQVMRHELGHLFRNKEWQELEYKRQVRKNKHQPPHGMPHVGANADPYTMSGPGGSRSDGGGGGDGGREGEEEENTYAPKEPIDPNTPDGSPMTHYWERTDLGIPYDAAVPDLTTPTLERLHIEVDQLEDERLALRKELGLMDLGDIREGRDPIIPGDVKEMVNKSPDDISHWMKTTTGEGPFQPPPVTSRWKPKCWEEPWGTGGGFLN